MAVACHDGVSATVSLTDSLSSVQVLSIDIC